jgi:CHAT domain-containing protein
MRTSVAIEALVSRNEAAVNALTSPRGAVESLRAAAAALVEEAPRLFGVDPRRMEQVCRDALSLAGRAGDQYLSAMATWRLGDALRAQNQDQAALQAYVTARETFALRGDRLEAACTTVGWCLSASRTGKLPEALARARADRRILSELGQSERIATLDLNVGVIYNERGLHREALRNYTRALNVYASLGETGRVGVGRARANRGLALTRLGRYREALQELEEARRIAEELGNHAEAARRTRTLGEYQMNLGHFAAALRTFETVAPAYEAAGIGTESLRLARDRADCYLRLGRPADALELLEGLELTHFEQLGPAVAMRRAAALLYLGRNREALDVLAAAEDSSAAAGLDQQAWLAAQRAAILLADGATDEALAIAGRAEALARRTGSRRLLADALLTRTGSLLALGDTVAAAPLAERVRRLARKLDAAPILGRTYELLGQIAEAEARPAAARQCYAAAIDQLERQQRNVIFEFRDSFAAGRTLAYERLAVLQLEAGDSASALATVERAKSRAIADAILGKVQLRPRGGAEARRLQRELDQARSEYAALTAQVEAGEAQAAAAAGLALRLGETEKRIERAVQRLQLTAADQMADLYGSSGPSTPPLLPEGTAMLELFTAGDDLLRFLSARGDITGSTAAGVMPDVTKLLGALRMNLAAAERSSDRSGLEAQARQILQRLYDCLLDGLELDAYASLVIVPHGPLHYLPFHALHSGKRYLVERAAITYAPSSALHEVCRLRAERRYRGHSLVVGHSSGGRLPSTLDEAVAVASVLGSPAQLEDAASRELLTAKGRAVDILHVAAHGSFRADSPMFSAIELADGPLTAADIFGLDIRARLVTLSACETGRAVLGGGDELVGLTRAFLYAGAAGLLVSQWRVEDASTTALMKAFYAELRRGATPAAALQAVQCRALHNKAAGAPSAHPFDWAGFQYIGAAQSPRPPGRKSKKE